MPIIYSKELLLNHYPKHILEPIRAEIACVYLKREMRKLLPALRGKLVWENIDSQIDNWADLKEITSIRDFWNGFHGIAMGFKLKNGFIQVLTAENVSWHWEEKLPLDENLAVGGDLKYISEELSEKRPKASRLKIFFEKNTELADHWRQEFLKHGQSSEPRDHFPIIAMEEVGDQKSIISIHDGNRRAILAILQGKSIISAYVGKYKTSQKVPQNFWLPTSFLMELVKEGELVGEELYPQTLSLLRGLVKLSKSGGYELKERVLIGKNEFRMRLKKDLGWN